MSAPTDADRLLAALSDGQPHSHKDLYRLGLMAHSRAADLRKRGYTIEVERDGANYMYRLTGSPGDSPRAIEAAAAPDGEAAAAEQLTLDDARSARASGPEWS